MKIFIYEEEKIYRDRLQNLIDDFLAAEEIKPLEQCIIENDAHIHKLMTIMSQHNIYFIDLENDGLNIARTVRDLDPLGYIILLSQENFDCKAIFNKKISALTLIHKNDSFDFELIDVFKYIARRYKQVRKIDNVIEIQSKPNQLTFVINEIVYFEASSLPHKVWMYGHHRDIEFYGTLSAVEHASEQFFRVHRGIIVNIANIDYIDDSSRVIYLSNGDNVRYSQRSRKILFEKYHTFQKHRNRNRSNKKRV